MTLKRPTTMPACSSFVLLLVVTVGFSLSAFSEVRLDAERQKTTETLDLLKEETVETIVLNRPVHFTAPDATDIVADPDIYRVVAGDPHRLKLMPSKGKPALTVEALTTTHEERIASPMALYVQDDEKFPHVVLLLPGGQGLEALGSYDAARARGIRSFQLTPIQIQKALKEKLAKPDVQK
ncbi:MAG TPA: hypothetical protein VHQ67_01360 [Nitrospiraceae bacterium]|nr:hypothetical protein [Nitrospiraceae bacterium]